jgi:hypothetical protein
MHTCIVPKPNWAYLDQIFERKTCLNIVVVTIFPRIVLNLCAPTFIIGFCRRCPHLVRGAISRRRSHGNPFRAVGSSPLVEIFSSMSIGGNDNCAMHAPSSPLWTAVGVATVYSIYLARWMTLQSNLLWRAAFNIKPIPRYIVKQIGDCGSRERYLPNSTYIPPVEYHSVCPQVGIGTPLTPPPPPHQGGGYTRLRVGEGGSQFGRLEGKPSTLSTLWFLLS